MIWVALVGWPLGILATLIDFLPGFTAPEITDNFVEWAAFAGYLLSILDPIIPVDFLMGCLSIVVGVGLALRLFDLGIWVYEHLPVVGSGG